VKRGVSGRRGEADAELAELIREIVLKRRRRCGCARAGEASRRDRGEGVGRKKAAALMRRHGLNARGRRKLIRAADSRHSPPVCPNIPPQRFHAAEAGEKWALDIACSRATGWRVSLTVVLDMFDRKVIGRALSGDMEAAHTTLSAMEGFTFHSDRGARYCAASFRDWPWDRCPSVRRSVSRKGKHRDNACAETFFKTLKRELETADGGHGEAEVRQSVFLCLEAYYNRIPSHSTLDYVAPNVFNSGKAP
jgi:transposase InsO family protein